MYFSRQELISTVDSAEEKLVKSARHAPIREKTLDTLSVQRNTRNKLVKQESLLQRHIKTVETFEELIKQIKEWLAELKENVSGIKERPLPEEADKINETLQEIEVRNISTCAFYLPTHPRMCKLQQAVQQTCYQQSDIRMHSHG